MVSAEDAIRNFKAQNKIESTILCTRRLAAQQEGRDLARKLMERYPQIGRVWGFGSTFETWRHYRHDSDIDIAVEHGDGMELLKAVELSTFKVDIVALPEVPVAMSTFIRTQGTLLGEVQS